MEAFLSTEAAQVEALRHQTLLSPLTDKMDSVLALVPSLVDVAGDDFSLTREALKEAATATSTSPQSGEMAKTCSFSLLREPHFPLLVSPLPFPDHTFRFAIPSGEVVVVPTPQVVSQAHLSCLEKHFPSGWGARCKQAARDRPVGVFDVFQDRRATKYVGSLLLSKNLARSKGRLIPVIGIESIVVDTPNRGGGSVLFAIAKELLFTDAAGVEQGILFAQCVPNPFWNDLLDVSTAARCLVFQMAHLYSRFFFEPDCHLRSRVFYRDDDLESVHAKKIPRASR